MSINHFQKLVFGGMIFLFLATNGYAQSLITVTGKITDTANVALSNVSVNVKGKSTGAISDASGMYSIKVAQNGTLVFSSVGYAPKEIRVSGKTLDVTLTPAIQNAGEEVIVTALGIKRQSKSIGYAVQEVKGESIVATREPNITNALSGQVAGLQVVRSSNGPGGSSKILLRGFSSLTGDNQPLIVIDGVPMNNFVGQSNSDYWNPSLDMGNGLSDLNAEDIAGISVLKGPSAAALYGTRAGNGVILITTKSGKIQKGLGLTVSSSVGFESPFMIPKLQNDFSQGNEGVFKLNTTSSWGQKIDGKTIVTQIDSTKSPLKAYNNVSNFLKTGIVSNHNISFQQQYKSTSVYTSYNRVDNMSMIPGATLVRNNITTRAISKTAGDKLILDAKIQYNNTNVENRPLGGPGVSNNTFALLYLFPRTIDITQFSNPLNEKEKMRWFGGGAGVNPYWSQKYRLNNDSRDRFLLNGSLKYELNSWINAELRAGRDMYTTNTQGKVYAGSPLFDGFGNYRLGKETFAESNYSGMITAKKDDLFEKIGGSLMIGGNLMDQRYSSISADAGILEVPNLFSLNNGRSKADISEGFYQKRINSLFGSGQINYDGFWFIDATFRNDWSSTLSKANRSFFYPSISTSLIISDLLNKINSLPGFLSYGKLRASYASVGNDLRAYQLYNAFTIGKDPNGITNAGRRSTLFNDSVKNELIKNIELGAEFKFFNNRLGIDFSYYKSNATNQLIGLPMDRLSGYRERMINAGNIENQGVELVISGRILSSEAGLNWNSSINISRNRSKIIELSKSNNITRYQLGGFDEVKVWAIAGSGYGDIYGSTFNRVTDKSSPYYGQLLLNTSSGLPERDPKNQSVYLGNQQADALLGWSNTFSYKNIALSFMIDGRFGGKIFSGTNVAMQRAGTAAVTVTNGERKAFIVDGVVSNGSNGYVKNTKEVTPQQYWSAITSGNLGITEANVYDATNIRVRSVQINYQLPNQLANKAGLQSVRLGISCNNVWMLKSYLNGVDPESVFATGTNAIGFENLNAPTSRTLFFNLALSF